MVPRIRMLSFLEGAEAATGACVVIDVFRAFSLVPWALMGGARMVVPVRTEAEALAWKRRDPTVLLAGERDGKPLPGFDFGNSPSEIRRADLAGRVLIHRTSAGTQGLLAALEAGAFPVLAGSFLTAGATIRYLKSLELSELSIVAMGWNARDEALEDVLCAEFLKARLLGEHPDFGALRSEIREHPTGQRFFDPRLPWFPEEDFEHCMELDRYDSAIVATVDDAYGIRLQAAD
ncbi:MAG: 2-phosphosulfolactate phosphatase [Gammaproteobacteria bacterium]